MMEKQLQQQVQQVQTLQKQQQQAQAQPQQTPAAAQQNAQEMEKLRKDLQTSNVEKERFQAQLEMLVQELEKRQVDIIYKKNFATLKIRFYDFLNILFHVPYYFGPNKCAFLLFEFLFNCLYLWYSQVIKCLNNKGNNFKLIIFRWI